jgi:hypothetical protein
MKTGQSSRLRRESSRELHFGMCSVRTSTLGKAGGWTLESMLAPGSGCVVRRASETAQIALVECPRTEGLFRAYQYFMVRLPPVLRSKPC